MNLCPGSCTSTSTMTRNLGTWRKYTHYRSRAIVLLLSRHGYLPWPCVLRTIQNPPSTRLSHAHSHSPRNPTHSLLRYLTPYQYMNKPPGNMYPSSINTTLLRTRNTAQHHQFSSHPLQQTQAYKSQQQCQTSLQISSPPKPATSLESSLSSSPVTSLP